MLEELKIILYLNQNLKQLILVKLYMQYERKKLLWTQYISICQIENHSSTY